jgi:hypothetical protein
MTQVANWIAAGISDTGGKFANSIKETSGKFCHQFRLCCWFRWQIMKTISDCRHLKVNLKAKCYLYYPKVPKQNYLNFSAWRFFSICHRWCTLSREYLRQLSKKIEMAVMVYSDAWGKLIHEKNQKSKISRHCPFKIYGHNLESFRLEVSIYNVYITNQFQTTFAQGRGGGGRGRSKRWKTFVPITPKNSASGNRCKYSCGLHYCNVIETMHNQRTDTGRDSRRILISNWRSIYSTVSIMCNFRAWAKNALRPNIFYCSLKN